MEQEDSNPHIRKTLAFAFVIPILLTGIWAFLNPPAAPSKEFSQVLTASLDVPATLKFGFEVDSFHFSEEFIAANENLSEILQRYHVPTHLLRQLTLVSTDIFDVRKIRAHKPYTLVQRKDSLQSARGFIYHPNPWNTWY